MKDLEINTNRLEVIVKELDSAFKEGFGLLNDKNNLLENQIPKGVNQLSKKQACFMFFTALNDHGTKSSIMYEKSKELFGSNPNLFEPNWIVENLSENDAVELISKKIGARYPQQLAKSWLKNAEILKEFYNSNPIEMFCSSNDATKLIATLKSFRGVGTKIGGMILRAIIGTGFNKNVFNIEKVLVPVDIHDSRIMFLTESFVINNNEKVNYYKYVDIAQTEILKACNRCNINWLDVDRALWLTGSNGCVYDKCDICILNKYCIKGIKNGKKQ